MVTILSLDQQTIVTYISCRSLGLFAGCRTQIGSVLMNILLRMNINTGNYWGQLYMADAMQGIADYAQKQYQKKPDAAVQIGFLPSSIWYVFEYAKEYDFTYGERFYDLSWNHGLTHEEILSAIEVIMVPTIQTTSSKTIVNMV